MNPIFKIVAGAVYVVGGAVLMAQGIKQKRCVECDEETKAGAPEADEFESSLLDAHGAPVGDSKSFIESLRDGE